MILSRKRQELYCRASLVSSCWTRGRYGIKSAGTNNYGLQCRFAGNEKTRWFLTVILQVVFQLALFKSSSTFPINEGNSENVPLKWEIITYNYVRDCKDCLNLLKIEDCNLLVQKDGNLLHADFSRFEKIASSLCWNIFCMKIAAKM